MAVVHKKGSPLYDKGMNEAGKFIAIASVGVLITICVGNATKSDMLPFMILVGFLIVGGYYSQKASILLHGSWGEHKTLTKLTDRLSDDYHIFVGVKVHEKMESDMVITGPNGVFVVEIKNFKGKIEGRTDDKEWILHKVGQEGGRYTKTIKNPLGQLRRNVYILSKYLKLQKSPAWIEGRTYFANNNEWKNSIPDNCISNIDVLAHFINVYMPKDYLSSKELARINANLEKCISETPAMTVADFEANAFGISR